MKNNLSIFLGGILIFGSSQLSLLADPPTKEKPTDKTKSDPKKEVTKEEKEATTMLDRFLTSTPYSREETKNLKSPFVNLITVEKIKKAIEDKRLEDEKNRKALTGIDVESPENTNPDQKDKEIKRILIIQAVQKGLEVVAQLVEAREFDLAEKKLVVLDQTCLKNNVEEPRAEISKKKMEVAAEKKDWEEINKIINSLSVDAMFVAEGKKKVALINDIAVEEGDDLNDLLSLAKESPVILTFVSNNSLKIKYKKFTLQKELIDNDL